LADGAAVGVGSVGARRNDGRDDRAIIAAKPPISTNGIANMNTMLVE
jgi:hypothetical protein